MSGAQHVRIAIDNFGTGYSSPAYLGRLPGDIIKIGPSFAQSPALPDGPMPWAFTRALLQLVGILNMDAVAEEVETPEQAHALRQLLCRLAQGDLFARPMPRQIVDQGRRRFRHDARHPHRRVPRQLARRVNGVVARPAA